MIAFRSIATFWKVGWGPRNALVSPGWRCVGWELWWRHVGWGLWWFSRRSETYFYEMTARNVYLTRLPDETDAELRVGIRKQYEQ